MGNLRLKLRAVFFGLTAIVLLGSIMPVSAQTSSGGGSGLSISPTESDFTLKPGQTGSVTLTIQNITSQVIIAQPQINDFESDGSTGNPRIIANTNQVSPNSIRKFVSGLQSITLAVGEQKTVTLPLKAPANVSPGAYFGIIRFKASTASSLSKSSGTQVALTASVGSIVLITVPGNIKHQVQLSALHIYGGSKDNPFEGSFFLTQPNQAGVEVDNLGNGFEQPYGTVQISRTLGGKVVDTYQLNSTNPRGNVLPDSTRIFKNSISKITVPGRYTMTASVVYGDGSNVLALTKSFWYVPTWLAVTLLVILVILVLATLNSYRRYRKDNKRSYRHAD